MKAAWIATCVAAVDAGCTGCFIDQSNVNVAGDAIAGGATKAAAAAYATLPFSQCSHDQCIMLLKEKHARRTRKSHFGL